METTKINLSSETATHSGWTHFYVSFSKFRDDCIELGRNVMSNDVNLAVQSLSAYHSSLYSMAQQLFSFYNETQEEELTEEWLNLGEEVSTFLALYGDKDFRAQMVAEGSSTIDIKLKVKLLKYFNKIDRMAANAGLLVGKEEKGGRAPKKGLIGVRK